jgi:hypothetical protein
MEKSSDIMLTAEFRQRRVAKEDKSLNLIALWSTNYGKGFMDDIDRGHRIIARRRDCLNYCCL